MGRGNESLIAKSGSHDQDGRHGKNRWNKQLEPSQVSYRTLGPLVIKCISLCHGIPVLGRSPIKWMQHSYMTLAVGWYIKQNQTT